MKWLLLFRAKRCSRSGTWLAPRPCPDWVAVVEAALIFAALVTELEAAARALRLCVRIRHRCHTFQERVAADTALTPLAQNSRIFTVITPALVFERAALCGNGVAIWHFSLGWVGDTCHRVTGLAVNDELPWKDSRLILDGRARGAVLRLRAEV
eukprot:6210321-Pleurochrysis_carterae.AAC.3